MTIMHDIEMVTIWFGSVIAGVILTMLMPQMVSAPRYRNRIHDGLKEVSPSNKVEEQLGSMVLVTKAPDVHIVSTSWAWGTPHAASDREDTSPPRAA